MRHPIVERMAKSIAHMTHDYEFDRTGRIQERFYTYAEAAWETIRKEHEDALEKAWMYDDLNDETEGLVTYEFKCE